MFCCGGCSIFWFSQSRSYTRVDLEKPNETQDVLLQNDNWTDKNTTFNADLIDRRPMEQWQINQSDAVVTLDIDLEVRDSETHLMELHPSYAAAIRAAKAKLPRGYTILPSVNLFDAKCKQFDDGLYAALDQAYYRGLNDKLRSVVKLVKRILDRLGPEGEAASFLAAGLELVGEESHCSDRNAKERYLKEFHSNEVSSKPISFYSWNDALGKCFVFFRFFQREFAADELVPQQVAKVLSADGHLFEEYRRAITFYEKLTNRSRVSTLLALAAAPNTARELGRVAFFPPSTSREVVLFEQLFPLGLPPNSDLMRELIKRIRNGAVDLAPKPSSGWYEYQVYALETLLLPEKAPEHNKLFLTRAYKERMTEAFKALITKRRETHVRQLGPSLACDDSNPDRPPIPTGISPRLRIEPNPTFYLRTARAYDFLLSFLETTIGAESLAQLHGLRQEGVRPRTLANELMSIRDLAYGAYLVSCEDIGVRPAFLKDERVDVVACYKVADNWLASFVDDPDLAVDTRSAVPIYLDPGRDKTRLWATLGLRMAKLEAAFGNGGIHTVRVKLPAETEWQKVDTWRLGKSYYLIPGDEFAEFDLRGLKSLTRTEFRAVCDKYKTKPEIIRALNDR